MIKPNIPNVTGLAKLLQNNEQRNMPIIKLTKQQVQGYWFKQIHEFLNDLKIII